MGAIQRVSDATRQLATLAGTMSFVGLGATGDYHEDGPLRSPVVPAAGAFSIWGPIYLGNLGLVVHQALPSEASDPLMRDIGWPLAVAYGGAGVWSRTFALQNLPLSLGLVAVTTTAAGLAYHRLPRYRRPDGREQWLVRVPVGMLFGWLTVATAAAVTEELLTPDTSGLAVDPEDLALLAIGATTAVAAAVTVGADRTLAYPAAVAWGLGGIVLAQRDRYPAVAWAAGLGLIGLGLATLVALGRRQAASRRPARRVRRYVAETESHAPPTDTHAW